MIIIDKELLKRAKDILQSDYASDEEIIYISYLLNNYIDNPSLKLKIHLTDVCFYVENRIKEETYAKNYNR